MNEQQTAAYEAQAHIEHEQPKESFLEMLYHHQERHALPVVDEVFIKTFRALGEEDQVKAMGHIALLIMNVRPDQGSMEYLYLGRLQHLHKTWYEYMTEDWVWEHYGERLDDEKWARARAHEKALGEQEDLVARIVHGEAPLPGEESAFEDSVINAFGGVDTVSLEEAKEKLDI